jgi:mevalonate kinase
VTSASACGKTILLGEHAVVYGRPAIAVPVSDVRAHADVLDAPPGSGVSLVAQDLGQVYALKGAGDSDTAKVLRTTMRNTLARLGVSAERADLRVVVSSQIPIARGLGSGAALATALVRALVAHYGGYLAAREVSELVYQSETILHGTPSGVDNTVVAYEKPVYFVKGVRADIFWLGRPFTLVIADTGVPSRTRDAVQDLRQRWQADSAHYEQLFDAIGALVERGQQAMATGDLLTLGALMNENQQLLCALDISCAALDRLIAVARAAGALGCKLTGGGRGGCLVALVDPAQRDAVSEALLLEGAARVIPTVVQ